MVKRYLLSDEGDADWDVLDRRIRDLETGLVLFSASITRGFGVRVAIPAGIRFEGLGTLTAGGLLLSPADGGYVQAGSAFVRGSGGGQVGAGGTLIGGDGRISNASGVNSFNGGVAASGGVSGTDASFSGTLGAASAYVTGSTNVGGMYSRGAIASESTITGTRVRGTEGVDTPWKGGLSNVEAIGIYVEILANNAQSAANAAQSAANAAQSTANGRVTQAQANAIIDYITAVANAFNAHMDAYHSGSGKVNQPPPIKG